MYEHLLSRSFKRRSRVYSADTESEFHAKVHEQLRVKDLPRVPTRRMWISGVAITCAGCARHTGPRPPGAHRDNEIINLA